MERCDVSDQDAGTHSDPPERWAVGWTSHPFWVDLTLFPCPLLLHVDSRLMDQHIFFGLHLPLCHCFPTH